MPDELGFAGPFAGVHNDALIMAGGANFAKPVWDHDKQWHDEIFVLVKNGLGKDSNAFEWKEGGKQIPWWAAGCSIFATMLSSLTFTGIPSKSFAQDWVYSIGNLMIPVVAVLAVFVVMPFYRRIDATSAYEYLEKRFSPGVRLFGSASFTLFHVFRMAVVMSLTDLALGVATPLTIYTLRTPELAARPKTAIGHYND